MILDCKVVADKIAEEIKNNFKCNKNPVLAVIYDNSKDEGQKSYVKSIKNIANSVGVDVVEANIDTVDFRKKILNKDFINFTDGILVVNPVNKFEGDILKGIIPEKKDIDDFTGEYCNYGCTACGVFKILEHHIPDFRQKKIVVAGGRGSIGRQVVSILTENNATPIPIHSKTHEPEWYTKNADIIISATGQKGLITENMVSPNCIIIDVGRGDVSEELYEHESIVATPKNNGTGLVTTMELMKRTFANCEKFRGRRE